MQGSKRKQNGIIASLFPLDTTCLIEAFCGSAAATLAIRAEGYRGQTIINDLNSSITRLWHSIIEAPTDLSLGYSKVWQAQFEDPFSLLSAKEYFNIIRDRFNNADVEDPADFLFILNRIVKGALRYNSSGKINQAADGRRRGAQPHVTDKRIHEASALMRKVLVQNKDWRDIIALACTTDFLYLDPPYQGTTETAEDIRLYDTLRPEPLSIISSWLRANE